MGIMEIPSTAHQDIIQYKRIFKCIRSFDNRFEVNWPPEPTLVLRWISKFFLFGALPSDTLKIKHTNFLNETPSRHVLENLLEKSKHSCLYTSETHWQFTGILPIYSTIVDYRKYSGIVFLGP